MINLYDVRLLRRRRTGPYKELYRVKKGDVRLLN